MATATAAATTMYHASWPAHIAKITSAPNPIPTPIATGRLRPALFFGFGTVFIVALRQYEKCCRFNGSTWEQNLKDRKSTRLNSSHVAISYAVFCLKKKKK